MFCLYPVYTVMMFIHIYMHSTATLTHHKVALVQREFDVSKGTVQQSTCDSSHNQVGREEWGFHARVVLILLDGDGDGDGLLEMVGDGWMDGWIEERSPKHL